MGTLIDVGVGCSNKTVSELSEMSGVNATFKTHYLTGC